MTTTRAVLVAVTVMVTVISPTTLAVTVPTTLGDVMTSTRPAGSRR